MDCGFGLLCDNKKLINPNVKVLFIKRVLILVRLPGAMVARLASIADGTKRLQVRVLRWSFLALSFGGGFHLS